MNKKLLQKLVCPRCMGLLEYRRKQSVLVCQRDRLAFPIRNGIPVLLEIEAKDLADKPG